MLEQFEAGDRDDAGRHAFGLQGLCGLQRQSNFGAGAEQGDFRLAVGGLQLIGALARQVLAGVGQADRRGLLTRQAHARRRLLVLQGDLPALQRLDGVGGAEDHQVGDGAQGRQMLDRLVGRAVFAQTDRVMGQDVNHAHAHQGGQADRRAAVVREDHEGAGVGDDAAVQGHAVHGRAHAVFTHAPVDVTTGVVGRVEDLGVLDEGVVRAGQVGRAADQFGDGVEHRLQRLARGLARGQGGLARNQFLQLGVQGLEGAGGQVAGHGAGEVVALGVVQQASFPRLARLGALLADLGPGLLDAFRQVEGVEGPVQGLTRGGDLGGAQGGAVGLVAAFHGGGALADLGLAGDQRRLRLLGRPGQGLLDLPVVVAVDGLDRPARGLEAGQLVGVVRQRHLAVDGDLVVVPHDAELVQLQTTGQGDGFLRHAFHQAAVAGDDPGAVVDQIRTEAGGQVALSQGETDRVGDALTQGAGGRLDAGHVTVFRVAGGLGAPLAEVFQLFAGRVLVAGQVQQAVDQHRAVARRQDEAVAVGPVGAAGVELQEFRVEDGGDVGHAHGHSGVAALGLFDAVHGQDANGVGHLFGRRLGECSLGVGHGETFPQEQDKAGARRLYPDARTGSIRNLDERTPMDAVTAAKTRIDKALALLERKVLELKARPATAPAITDDDLFAPRASNAADLVRIAELEAAGRDAAEALGRAAEAVREVLAEQEAR
ncbi:hypothetical protein D3C86_1162460 [compost metagenome]